MPGACVLRSKQELKNGEGDASDHAGGMEMASKLNTIRVNLAKKGHKDQGFVRLKVQVVVHDQDSEDKPDYSAYIGK